MPVLMLVGAAALGAQPPPSSDAEARLREASALWETGALGSAMAAAERVLASLEPGSPPALEARCRDLIANVADSQGEFARGMEEHARALRLAERAGDARLEAVILADTGLGRWRCAEYAQALAYLDRALALQSVPGLERDRARTLDLIGRVHFKQGDRERALDHHTRALALQEAAGDLAGAAVTHEDIGDVHRDHHAFARAIDHYQRSLALREATGDGAGQTWVLTVLGTTHMMQGAFAEAERAFLRALAIAEEAEDGAGRAQALYHLGLVHLHMGEHLRAVTSLAIAARLHEALADRRSLGWDLEFLGQARQRTGDDAGALRDYERALTVREAIHDLRGVASTLFAMGGAQEAAGLATEALATYRRALALGEELHLPHVCLTLGRIGRVLAAQGRGAEAIDHGRRGVERARALASPGLEWQACWHLAESERRLGHRDAALAALEDAMAAIDRLRPEAAGRGESAASFLDDKQEVFAAAVALLFEAGREGAALAVAERARARAFLELIGEQRQAPPPATPPVARGGNTGRSWPGTAADPSPVAPAPPSLAAIRDAARRRRATVLEYFVAGDRLYAWCVLPDGSLAAAATTIARRDLEALVEAVRRRLAEPAESPAAASLADPWRRLHRLLVEPLAASLPEDADALFAVAPHGPLWAVPFAALRDAAGRRLVERHTIAYVPGAGALAPGERRAASAAPRSLIVGDPATSALPDVGPLAPLPGAAREADEIAAVLGARRATLLTGAAATERAVRALAPAHGWLHLATHGVIRDDAPLDSLLVLGGGGRSAADDGRWTAREILELELDADLVVLSGCDTGRGRITSEGVLGLGRAFLSAGARSVVASLAPVDDAATRALMVRFYRRLVGDPADRAAALRHAQLAALAEPPSHWAPFVLLAGAL